MIFIGNSVQICVTHRQVADCVFLEWFYEGFLLEILCRFVFLILKLRIVYFLNGFMKDL